MTNAEKYKTAQERDKAFEEFCKKIESCWACGLGELCYKKRIKKCSFLWLELEVEEEDNEKQ
jgi:hypothetical protein